MTAYVAVAAMFVGTVFVAAGVTVLVATVLVAAAPAIFTPLL